MFSPIVTHLTAFLSGINFTIDARLAEAGADALLFYEWSKRFARSGEEKGLPRNVEEMRRVVQRTINRRKKRVRVAKKEMAGAAKKETAR